MAKLLSLACRSIDSKQNCDLAPLSQPSLKPEINGFPCQKNGDAFICGSLSLPVQFQTGKTSALLSIFDPTQQTTTLTRFYLPRQLKLAQTEQNMTEKEVEESLNALDQLKGLDFIFRGKSYFIGREDVSGAVNSALQASHSLMRVFISADSQIKPTALYAPLLSEKMVKVEDSTIRFTTIGAPKKKIGNFPSNPAFNDRLAAVLIRSDVVQTEMNQKSSLPTRLPPYKKNVYLKIHSDFFKRMGGANDSHLHEILHSIENHEEVHFRLEATYGEELGFLQHAFLQRNQAGLKMMEELYANLGAIDSLLALSKRDLEAAKKAFHSLTIYYGPSSKREMNAAAQASYLLLLSVANLNQGAVEIDWEKLNDRKGVLRSLLEDDFKDLAYNIQVSSLRLAGKIDLTNLEGVDEMRKKYQTHRENKIRHDFKMLPPSLAKRAAAATLVNEILRANKAIFPIFLAQTVADQATLNDWMQEELDLAETLLPFKIPESITVK